MKFKNYLIKKRSKINGYFTSLVLLFLSLAAIYSLENFLGSQLRSLVLLATLLSAMHGGLGPGIMCAILGPLVVDLLFIAPDWRMISPWTLFIRVSVYFFTSILVAGLTSLLRKYISQAEELRAKAETASKDKDGLMAIVAHDLKNPLNVILGYIEMVKDQSARDKTPEIVEIIERNCSNSLELIDRLQEYAQMGHGQYQIKKEKLNLPNLLAELILSLQVLAARKNIELNLVCNGDEINVQADKALLSRAIQNLVDNAIKYSPFGSKVEITCAKDFNNAMIKVADQGPGIAKEEMENLFKPFYKTSNLPTAHETSTGLGLAMVKSTLELHGGNVHVQSQKGEGSVFTVLLPLCDVEALSIETKKQKR